MASIDYSIYRSFFYHNLYYEVSRWFDLHPELSRDEGIIPLLRELVRDLDPHKWQHSYVNRELANQTLYALKLMKDSIVKLDPSLWEKIQKAIDYYQDLCKEEDEELEKMKSASDDGYDMFPYFDGVNDDSEKKEEQEKDDDDEEEVHFVHHHTKPLVLFDETEIIDENECEKDGAEKFEYEELPSRDEDEDDDDDDDDDVNQLDVNDDEKEDESIIITTTITRKRSRNVDYEKNSDVEKHERPKKRLRCVRMFPRIIKYYF